MAMMWVLWGAAAFAAAALAFAIWRRVERRRKFEANRDEIRRISGHYGIPEDDALDLIGLPPEEIAERAHKIALENR